jgi:hypothetical protein
MNDMDIEHISREDVEKGLSFLKNGLPEGALPIGGGQFSGYYTLTREINNKKVRISYEPCEIYDSIEKILFLEMRLFCNSF